MFDPFLGFYYKTIDNPEFNIPYKQLPPQQMLPKFLTAMDSTQIINGLAVLLSFFAGYKYAQQKKSLEEEKPDSPAQSSPAGDAVAAALSQPKKPVSLTLIQYFPADFCKFHLPGSTEQTQ